MSSLRSHHSLYEPLLSFAYAPWLQYPDRGYFDSVSTQLELSVVSLFSGGREKEHLPNKVVRYIASSATNSARQRRRTLNKGDYFYLDNLHKDPIEICSSKNHSSRGVPNLDGNLNADKNEKFKKRKGSMSCK